LTLGSFEALFEKALTFVSGAQGRLLLECPYLASFELLRRDMKYLSFFCLTVETFCPHPCIVLSIPQVEKSTSKQTFTYASSNFHSSPNKPVKNSYVLSFKSAQNMRLARSQLTDRERVTSPPPPTSPPLQVNIMSIV
jgi:hypothetical protein